MMTAAQKPLVKVATAGSVDDGKSTLIGRMLYDAGALTHERLREITTHSQSKGYDYLDLSLATDGLSAEQAQGITIDVAHMYFTTPGRRFIIADTPGHAEYTRNMVTGASNMDTMIILMDVRKGILEQTRRHFFIASMLRRRQIIVAINKMDRVNFSQAPYRTLCREFRAMAALADIQPSALTFVPVSALYGDNVSTLSEQMPWYEGPTLMSALEQSVDEESSPEQKMRFQVQSVCRPKTHEHADFRGFNGTVRGAVLSVGDPVMVLPSGQRTSVKGIHFAGLSYLSVQPGSAVTVTLSDDVDAGRGTLIVPVEAMPTSSRTVRARVCQLTAPGLRNGDRVWLQHGVDRMLARVDEVRGLLPTDFGPMQPAIALETNDIGVVTLSCQRPLHFDAYNEQPATGSFILIHEQSCQTQSVGFIMGP